MKGSIIDNNELKKIIDLLLFEKKSNSDESYENIKNLLNKIEFPLPIFSYPKDSRFVRTRAHSNGEDYFENIDDLSYRKDVENIKKFGRANEPGQPMFYCSNDDTLSFIETSHIVRNLEAKEFEYSTNSLWIAKEELKLISFLNNDYSRGKNTDLDLMSNSFEAVLSLQNDENTRVINNLFKFISKEFSDIAINDFNQYKITCAITNYIFDCSENIDGILYPSTLYPTKGFNFVFKPSTVDSKLKFHIASRRKMVFDGTKSYFETELIDSKVHMSKDNKIYW